MSSKKRHPKKGNGAADPSQEARRHDRTVEEANPNTAMQDIPQEIDDQQTLNSSRTTIPTIVKIEGNASPGTKDKPSLKYTQPPSKEESEPAAEPPERGTVAKDTESIDGSRISKSRTASRASSRKDVPSRGSSARSSPIRSDNVSLAESSHPYADQNIPIASLSLLGLLQTIDPSSGGHNEHIEHAVLDSGKVYILTTESRIIEGTLLAETNDDEDSERPENARGITKSSASTSESKKTKFTVVYENEISDPPPTFTKAKEDKFNTTDVSSPAKDTPTGSTLLSPFSKIWGREQAPMQAVVKSEDSIEEETKEDEYVRSIPRRNRNMLVVDALENNLIIGHTGDADGINLNPYYDTFENVQNSFKEGKTEEELDSMKKKVFIENYRKRVLKDVSVNKLLPLTSTKATDKVYVEDDMYKKDAKELVFWDFEPSNIYSTLNNYSLDKSATEQDEGVKNYTQPKHATMFYLLRFLHNKEYYVIKTGDPTNKSTQEEQFILPVNLLASDDPENYITSFKKIPQMQFVVVSDLHSYYFVDLNLRKVIPTNLVFNGPNDDIEMDKFEPMVVPASNISLQEKDEENNSIDRLSCLMTVKLALDSKKEADQFDWITSDEIKNSWMSRLNTNMRKRLHKNLTSKFSALAKNYMADGIDNESCPVIIGLFVPLPLTGNSPEITGFIVFEEGKPVNSVVLNPYILTVTTNGKVTLRCVFETSPILWEETINFTKASSDSPFDSSVTPFFISKGLISVEYPLSQDRTQNSTPHSEFQELHRYETRLIKMGTDLNKNVDVDNHRLEQKFIREFKVWLSGLVKVLFKNSVKNGSDSNGLLNVSGNVSDNKETNFRDYGQSSSEQEIVQHRALIGGTIGSSVGMNIDVLYAVEFPKIEQQMEMLMERITLPDSEVDQYFKLVTKFNEWVFKSVRFTEIPRIVIVNNSDDNPTYKLNLVEFLLKRIGYVDIALTRSSIEKNILYNRNVAKSHNGTGWTNVMISNETNLNPRFMAMHKKLMNSIRIAICSIVAYCMKGTNHDYQQMREHIGNLLRTSIMEFKLVANGKENSVKKIKFPLLNPTLSLLSLIDPSTKRLVIDMVGESNIGSINWNYGFTRGNERRPSNLQNELLNNVRKALAKSSAEANVEIHKLIVDVFDFVDVCHTEFFTYFIASIKEIIRETREVMEPMLKTKTKTDSVSVNLDVKRQRSASGSSATSTSSKWIPTFEDIVDNLSSLYGLVGEKDKEYSSDDISLGLNRIIEESLVEWIENTRPKTSLFIVRPEENVISIPKFIERLNVGALISMSLRRHAIVDSKGYLTYNANMLNMRIMNELEAVLLPQHILGSTKESQVEEARGLFAQEMERGEHINSIFREDTIKAILKIVRQQNSNVFTIESILSTMVSFTSGIVRRQKGTKKEQMLVTNSSVNKAICRIYGRVIIYLDNRTNASTLDECCKLFALTLSMIFKLQIHAYINDSLTVLQQIKDAKLSEKNLLLRKVQRSIYKYYSIDESTASFTSPTGNVSPARNTLSPGNKTPGAAISPFLGSPEKSGTTPVGLSPIGTPISRSNVDLSQQPHHCGTHLEILDSNLMPSTCKLLPLEEEFTILTEIELEDSDVKKRQAELHTLQEIEELMREELFKSVITMFNLVTNAKTEEDLEGSSQKSRGRARRTLYHVVLPYLFIAFSEDTTNLRKCLGQVLTGPANQGAIIEIIDKYIFGMGCGVAGCCIGGAEFENSSGGQVDIKQGENNNVATIVMINMPKPSVEKVPHKSRMCWLEMRYNFITVQKRDRGTGEPDTFDQMEVMIVYELLGVYLDRLNHDNVDDTEVEELIANIIMILLSIAVQFISGKFPIEDKMLNWINYGNQVDDEDRSTIDRFDLQAKVIFAINGPAIADGNYCPSAVPWLNDKILTQRSKSRIKIVIEFIWTLGNILINKTKEQKETQMGPLYESILDVIYVATKEFDFLKNFTSLMLLTDLADSNSEDALQTMFADIEINAIHDTQKPFSIAHIRKSFCKLVYYIIVQDAMNWYPLPESIDTTSSKMNQKILLKYFIPIVMLVLAKEETINSSCGCQMIHMSEILSQLLDCKYERESISGFNSWVEQKKDKLKIVSMACNKHMNELKNLIISIYTSYSTESNQEIHDTFFGYSICLMKFLPNNFPIMNTEIANLMCIGPLVAKISQRRLKYVSKTVFNSNYL